MVVKVAGHKNAQRRRQRTIRISIFVDVCNELRCWRSHLTGDLPKPKIKRVFKVQGCNSAVNSYFSGPYPFACHLSHFDSGPSCPLLHCTRQPSRVCEGCDCQVQCPCPANYGGRSCVTLRNLLNTVADRKPKPKVPALNCRTNSLPQRGKSANIFTNKKSREKVLREQQNGRCDHVQRR